MAKLRQKRRTPAAQRRLAFMVWKIAAKNFAIAAVYALIVTTPVIFSVVGKWEARSTKIAELDSIELWGEETAAELAAIDRRAGQRTANAAIDDDENITTDTTANATEIKTPAPRTAEIMRNELKRLPPLSAFLGFGLYAAATLGTLGFLYGNKRFGLFNLDVGIAALLPLLAALPMTYFAWAHVKPLFWHAAWGFVPICVLACWDMYSLILGEYFKQHSLFRRFFVQGRTGGARFAGIRQFAEMEVKPRW